MRSRWIMDKTVLAFFADVLYFKGIICFEEFEAIMESKNEVDLGIVSERIGSDDFNVYKRGEAYVGYNK